MAPDPKCSAVAAALQSKGYTYAQVASKIGVSEQRVIDICTGASTPSADEFKALSGALGISDPPPGHTFA